MKSIFVNKVLNVYKATDALRASGIQVITIRSRGNPPLVQSAEIVLDDSSDVVAAQAILDAFDPIAAQAEIDAEEAAAAERELWQREKARLLVRELIKHVKALEAVVKVKFPNVPLPDWTIED